MSAIVLMELGVHPLRGCTLWHAEDDSAWTVAWGTGPDERLVLTREMVAEVLETMLYGGRRIHGYGAWWVFSEDVHALEFRAVVTEGEPTR